MTKNFIHNMFVLHLLNFLTSFTAVYIIKPISVTYASGLNHVKPNIVMMILVCHDSCRWYGNSSGNNLLTSSAKKDIERTECFSYEVRSADFKIRTHGVLS